MSSSLDLAASVPEPQQPEVISTPEASVPSAPTSVAGEQSNAEVFGGETQPQYLPPFQPQPSVPSPSATLVAVEQSNAEVFGGETQPRHLPPFQPQPPVPSPSATLVAGEQSSEGDFGGQNQPTDYPPGESPFQLRQAISASGVSIRSPPPTLVDGNLLSQEAPDFLNVKTTGPNGLYNALDSCGWVMTQIPGPDLAASRLPTALDTNLEFNQATSDRGPYYITRLIGPQNTSIIIREDSPLFPSGKPNPSG